MSHFLKVLNSQVGRKALVAVSGLLLVGFIITHLLGNLSLYLPEGTAFNAYALKLKDFGPLFYVGEVVLLSLFAAHALLAIGVTMKNKQARPVRYQGGYRSKGGPSHWNLSSTKMIVTGGLLLFFLVAHVLQFRFGPGVAEGYVTEIDGRMTRDLYRLVVETFSQPLYTIFYVFAMFLMGLHVRHGFWSAFQSLGAAHPKYTKMIHGLGVCLALILAAGFLFIPVWIYFDMAEVLR